MKKNTGNSTLAHIPVSSPKPRRGVRVKRFFFGVALLILGALFTLTLFTPMKGSDVDSLPSTPLERAKNFIKPSNSKEGSSSNQKIRWPRLTLSGLGMPSKGHKAFAIINHHHVCVGDSINGVTLIQIMDEEVVVKYKNEVHHLQLSQH